MVSNKLKFNFQIIKLGFKRNKYGSQKHIGNIMITVLYLLYCTKTYCFYFIIFFFLMPNYCQQQPCSSANPTIESSSLRVEWEEDISYGWLWHVVHRHPFHQQGSLASGEIQIPNRLNPFTVGDAVSDCASPCGATRYSRRWHGPD